MVPTKPGRAGRQKSRDRVPLAKMAGLVAILLLLASGYLWLIGAGMPPRTTAIGGPFQLVQGDGHSITDRSFPGKYLLIYFGYTSCRDVCPTTLTNVAAALDDLGTKADRVQPLFITIDPARDTPSVVKDYANRFTPRLVGLTGELSEIHKVADEYRVSSVRHGDAGAAQYEVDHSSVLYLMGPEGHFIAPIRADESASAMARSIADHLSW